MKFILGAIGLAVGVRVANQIDQHLRKPRFRSSFTGRRWVDTSCPV